MNVEHIRIRPSHGRTLDPGPGVDAVGPALPKLASAKKTWKDLVKWFGIRSFYWPDDLDAPDDVSSLARESVARLRTEVVVHEADADREAITVAVVTQTPHQHGSRIDAYERLVRYHIKLGGLPFAFEAQLRGAGYVYTFDTRRTGRVPRVDGASLRPGLPDGQARFRGRSGWKELRHRLAFATTDELAQCAEFATKRWPGLSHRQRAIAAYLLPSAPELASNVAAEAPSDDLPLIAHSLREPTRVITLLRLPGQSFPSEASVALIGPELAAPLLAATLTARPEVLARFVFPLTAFAHPEIADHLLDAVAIGRYPPSWVQPFVLAFPELSLPRILDRGLDDLRDALYEDQPELDPSAEPVASDAALPDTLLREARLTLYRWWTPARWSPLKIRSGEFVPPRLHRRFAEILAEADGEETEDLRALRDVLDPRSVSAFLSDAVDAWQGNARTQWVFLASVAFAHDGIEDELARRVRGWTGSHYPAAATGVRMLGRLGTERALMHLSHIAERHRTRGVKKLALRELERSARERGVELQALRDRLVPSFGLDEHGRMQLDYGPRAFEVAFDERLVPWIIDRKKKRHKTLPKPGKRDDAALSRKARGRFNRLKKDVRLVAAAQLGRLERAMVEQTTWRHEQATRSIYGHPLIRHIARRLLFSTSQEPFGFDEEGHARDLEDEPVSLDGDALVCVVHPCNLDDEALALWSDKFADYELIQPFAQLSRSVFDRDSAEHVKRSLSGLSLPPGRLLALLSRGWTRGEMVGGGEVIELERKLGTARARLWLREGFNVVGYDNEDECVIDRLELSLSGDHRDFSEVVYEASSLLL